ncbi:hypothetical protein [Zunongwangia pacifica]|uniref:Uncharacterized protein n=1 Tax=Zunongwangia pacifica TaxID=2911062 RepID=A0A9X1ZVC1_9FLAO|nr:hypothetical protein [Zunongwangia pacifica]MCL6220614.1 hypothetical protein [Zunongwangia pacifica]
MLKNYVSLALLLLLIQSCTQDDLIEEAEMNNQYKIDVEDLDLRESASTENDSVYNTTDTEGEEEGSSNERG